VTTGFSSLHIEGFVLLERAVKEVHSNDAGAWSAIAI
jgi:hypothetical protein